MKDIQSLLKEILLIEYPDAEYVSCREDYNSRLYIVTYNIYGNKDEISINIEDILLFLYNKIG